MGIFDSWIIIGAVAVCVVFVVVLLWGVGRDQ